MPNCKICGKWNCKEHEPVLRKAPKKSFSGSSPPEIFVGKWNYPNVYAGLLAPEQYGDTSRLSSAEIWHKDKLEIPEIVKLRNELVYARTRTSIKSTSKLFEPVKEIAMSHRSVATLVNLKKPIFPNQSQDSSTPMILKAASVQSIKLEENPKIERKVDYLVNDTDVKSSIAMRELSKANIPVSTIVKILSAGLLGRKAARKLVPTRWSITAVDSNLSKEKLEKIKYFKDLQEIQLFKAEYLGNNYHFLLLPGAFAFEVIELSERGGVWQDYESNFNRTKYADSVTGAYYANRLALAEYLERIQRQASCLVMREIRTEYYAPCGVGILRETSRDAFTRKPEAFSTISQALQVVQSRLRLPIKNFTDKSWLLKNYGKQKRITEFF